MIARLDFFRSRGIGRPWPSRRLAQVHKPRRAVRIEGIDPTFLVSIGVEVNMDMTWVTDRIAVGGGIWNATNMQEVARLGITHVIDMQIEFDDTALAQPHGIQVLWNAIDDDFQPKPAEVFQRGVDFALSALDEPGTKVYIHCAAGVHRAPMMTLAVLCAMGWNLGEAIRTIEARRPVVDFADVYVSSVKRFLEEQVTAERNNLTS